jgi:hypothetical protein
VFDCIERFYNPTNSTIGYVSTIKFENAQGTDADVQNSGSRPDDAGKTQEG